MTEVSSEEIDVISQFVSRRNKVPAYTAGKIMGKYGVNSISFREKYLMIGVDEWGSVIYAVRPQWIHLAKKIGFIERFKNWINDLVE